MRLNSKQFTLGNGNRRTLPQRHKESKQQKNEKSAFGHDELI